MVNDVSYRRMLPPDAQIGSFVLRDGWTLRSVCLPPAYTDDPHRSDGAGDDASAQTDTGTSIRGSILFASGRGDFFEKYMETLAFWSQKGWSVTSFDWRGQGGSGRLGNDAFAGHVDDFSTWVDDLEEVVRQWQKKQPGPHFIVGHSMGGHIVLRHVAERKPFVAGVALIAPMIAFRTPLPKWFLTQLVTREIAKGQGSLIAWGQLRGAPSASRFRQARLTSDETRYLDEIWWLQQKPELALGGATWGWLDAAMRSDALFEEAGCLEKVTVPVALFASRHDRVVDTTAAIAAVSRIPQHDIALFDGEHELLRERDDIRDAVLDRITGFFDKVSNAEG